MMTQRTKIIGLLFKQESILKKSKDTETISMVRFTIYFKINIYKFAKKYLCLKNSTLFAYYLRNSFKTINYLIFFVNFWRTFFLTEKHFSQCFPNEKIFSHWKIFFSLRNSFLSEKLFFTPRSKWSISFENHFFIYCLIIIYPSTVILPFITIHASL